MKDILIDYFTEELKLNTDALKAYDPSPLESEVTDRIKEMREIEAIKLRDRVQELNRHIAVIKRMFPNETKKQK